MKERGWILPHRVMKVDFKLKREHWEKAKQDNINLILQCEMQTKMAHKILLMVEEELSKIPVPTPPAQTKEAKV